MTLSFPHLIYLAADSQYLFPDEGDVCRVTTSLYCAAGGHSALTAEPVCQLIRLDSFLSDLPDALNNCYPAVEDFAWWPLNSGHCVLHWGYLFLSCTQVCTEPLKAQNRRCIEKVNDGFVHSCPYSHNLNPVFIASLTPSSHGNHSPAIMRHLTPTLVFFFFFLQIFISLPLPFLPSLHPSPVLISLSLLLPHQLTGNCSFSSHNVSDSQFMQWQDSSIFRKFEVCGFVSTSSAMRSQLNGSTAPDCLWLPLNPSNQTLTGWGRAGIGKGPAPVCWRLLPRHD